MFLALNCIIFNFLCNIVSTCSLFLLIHLCTFIQMYQYICINISVFLTYIIYHHNYVINQIERGLDLRELLILNFHTISYHLMAILFLQKQNGDLFLFCLCIFLVRKNM